METAQPALNGSVKLESKEIAYLQYDNWTKFEDVVILAADGVRFGFNRCLLASVSSLCKTLFLHFYECPLANLDEVIYISSDFTSADLMALKDMFVFGKLTSPGSAECLSTLGVDQNDILASFKQSLSVKYTSLKYTVPDLPVNNKINGNHHELVAPSKVEVKLEVEDLYSEQPEYFYDDYDEPDQEEDIKPVKKGLKRTRSQTFGVTSHASKVLKKVQSDAPSKKKESFFHFPQNPSERDFTRPYQCELCVRGFFDEKEYRLHTHRHLLGSEDYDKAFLCDSCEKFECASAKEITEHRKKDCPIQKRNDKCSKFSYFCAICQPGVKFNTTKELHSHHQTLHKDTVTLNVGVSIVFCPTCGIQLNNAHTLKKHFMKEGPFHKDTKCVFCPKTFTTWDEHKDHLDKCHNGVFKFTCGFCNVNHFHTHNEYQNHKTMCKISAAAQKLPEYPDGKDISCTICGDKVAANIIDVRTHLKANHAALGMPCNICKEVYFNKRSLETHIKDNHMKNFACDRCDKVFGTGAKLRDHQKSHEAERNFVCNQCGKAFIRKHELRKHEQFTHEGIRTKSTSSNAIIHCELCGEGIRECRYNYHKSHCHSKETHECTDCGMKFKSKRRLNNHMNQIHVYTTCDYCGKQCNKNQMKNHILTNHTADSDRPFVCSICQKGFSKKERYNNHMNIHTGNRPHNCRYCTRNFADKANRNKHMRESHPAEYQQDKAKLQLPHLDQQLAAQQGAQ